MAKRRGDPKVAALRAERSLNPRPEEVADEAFASSEFFDARDLVQVKYEMVRRVRVDGEPVSRSAAAFGFSRPSFYQAAAAVDAHGLAGLVPARPGPRRAHKLTDEVVAFARQARAGDPVLRSAELAALIAERFGVSVHPRSVERALARVREPKSGDRDERRRARRRRRTRTNSSAAGRWPATRAGGAAGWRCCSTAAWWPGCVPGAGRCHRGEAPARDAATASPAPGPRTGSSRPWPGWRWRRCAGGEPR